MPEIDVRDRINEEVDNRDPYPATSRYKNARYFQRLIKGTGVRIEPEIWVPPEIPRTSRDLFTKVQAGEEGRLDLVALRVYRIGALWWVIAFSNDIIDPFTETTVNKILRYPSFDVVSATVLA